MHKLRVIIIYLCSGKRANAFPRHSALKAAGLPTFFVAKNNQRPLRIRADYFFESFVEQAHKKTPLRAVLGTSIRVFFSGVKQLQKIMQRYRIR
jgi:hypothetical protein